jgi:hypothetical protein
VPDYTTTYEIEYKDPDPGCPVFRWRCEAYSAEHAMEKFQDDGDDWEALRIARVNPKHPRYRWRWVTVGVRAGRENN